MTEDPLLCTIRDAASLLAVSPRTVEELLAREELPSLLIGRARRIRRADIGAFIEQRLEAEKDATAVHVQPLAPDAQIRVMKIRPSVTSRTDREGASTSGRTSTRS
jgi:excisionase family DNA binding protein